jgi:hypothetical protein
MLAIIALLQILDMLAALIPVFWFAFWLLVAAAHICWCRSFAAVGRLLSKTEAPTTTTETRRRYIIFKPAFPLHIIIYRTLLPQLPPGSDLLRGARFASLADSIIDGTADEFLQEHGPKWPSEKERKKMEYLKTLPELVVTPPDDGHRKPQRGEKGGRRVKLVPGLLAPVVRKSRAGKERREKERTGVRTRMPL